MDKHQFACADGTVIEVDERTWRAVQQVFCLAEGIARGDIVAYSHAFATKEDVRSYHNSVDGTRLDVLSDALHQQAAGVRHIATLWEGNVLGIGNRSFAVN